MTRTLGELRTTWLTGGIHLLILVVAFQAESSSVWPYALALMAIVSFFAWTANYRRYRQIRDLPTSRVASAAQGYVELFGRSEQISNAPVTSPFSALPCCWYRYCVDRKTNEHKWEHEDSGESSAHFLLKDDTGECVISPEGAEVLFARKSTSVRGDRRYTEWLLLPGGVLYAIGEFSTTSPADSELEPRGNAGVNLLRKPSDGRVFILAAELPDRIGRRFALWSWAHLALFFCAGAASYLMFSHERPGP